MFNKVVSSANSSPTTQYKLPPISSNTTKSIPISLPSIQHEPTSTIKSEDISYHLPSMKSPYGYNHTPFTPKDYTYNTVQDTHDWTEEPRIRKKVDMTERMKTINSEFIQNREVLYQEKIQQLQNELSSVEHGNHVSYNEQLNDLKRARAEMIENARLMMRYQIECVDKLFRLEIDAVMNEMLAEQKEIQNAMFTLLEEKRKRLKEVKDGEGEFSLSSHLTRNRQRISRKKEIEITPKSIGKKKDRLKDQNPLSHLANIFTNRSEDQLEDDFNTMLSNIRNAPCT
ncbi:Sds3-like-domain-containing protein [Pilobolus umbonatus]|nr:Sds3-like-domain-containing protein [Pilobolus umbonatus]